MMEKTVLEFFAGIGLMRFGLEAAGWSVAYANDIAADKLQQYADNFTDSASHFELGDVHTIDVDAIPTASLATASFPCTDLSLAGARKGLAGAQSSAFWGFIRVLEEMGERRPPLVMLENVAGFLTSHKGQDFESAMLALNDLGYSVDAFIIDASHFVPQSRVRLFVVARQVEGNEEAAEVCESNSFYGSDIRPPALADYIFTHPHIRWDIRELPRLPTRTLDLPDVLEDLPADATEWWNAKRTNYLLSQMSATHATRLAYMQSQREWSYGTVFRRVRAGRTMAEMRIDQVAGCLRTPKGGSARQILIKAGYGQVAARLLTARECARLMGADDFVINVPLNQALFGFGDAVCVPVVTWIAENYLNPLLQSLETVASMPNVECCVSYE